MIDGRRLAKGGSAGAPAPAGAGRKTVDRLVTRLRWACDPDEILLFGSYAKNTADRHSDIDLILVVAGFPSIALRNCAKDATRGLLGVDVMIHRRSELLAACSNPFGFLGSALRSSRSVYLRPGVTGMTEMMSAIR